MCRKILYVCCVMCAFLFSIVVLVSSSRASDTRGFSINATVPSIKYILSIDCSEGGSVIVNGKVVTGSFDIQVERLSDISVAIRPDSGYELDILQLNGRDALALYSGGFLNLSSVNKDNMLFVTFSKIDEEKKEDTSTKTYSIVGVIKKNGAPVANAKVELRSTLMTTYTDKTGYFAFYNVTEGHHSLTAVKDNIIIGYSEFVMSDNKGARETIKTEGINGIPQISIGDEHVTVEINLALNEDGSMIIYSIKGKDKADNTKTKTTANGNDNNVDNKSKNIISNKEKNSNKTIKKDQNSKDDEKKEDTKKSSIINKFFPKTSDHSYIIPCIVLIMISLGVFISILIYKKKNR